MHIPKVRKTILHAAKLQRELERLGVLSKVFACTNYGNNRGESQPIPLPIDRTHFKERDIDALWNKTQQLLGISVFDYLVAR